MVHIILFMKAKITFVEERKSTRKNMNGEKDEL